MQIYGYLLWSLVMTQRGQVYTKHYNLFPVCLGCLFSARQDLCHSLPPLSPNSPLPLTVWSWFINLCSLLTWLLSVSLSGLCKHINCVNAGAWLPFPFEMCKGQRHLHQTRKYVNAMRTHTRCGGSYMNVEKNNNAVSIVQTHNVLFWQ